MKLLLLFIDCLLIWSAIFLNRHGESRINLFDKNWLLVFLLATVGIIMISIYGGLG